jgi:hypothetical protein
MAEEQHIRIKAVLEIVGKPKDYVESQLKNYVEKIKEDENLMVMGEQLSPAEEQETVWSAFAEMELIIKGLTNLVGFCIDYMPSSIEVLKPESFSFPERVFTEFTNDLLAKLHNVDMIAKRMSSENKLLRENLNNFVKNHLLVLLKFGVSKLDKIAQATGITEEEAKKFLDLLIRENRVKEENGDYSLKNG